ncbi:hypothetical protein K2X14_13740 [Acetobacter sp. TBRC 12305]|uniref:Uncharacterized protein n=1 Tax=Acetobacter garciniae TaxID=2817435 RepID=A0A939HKB1_9PROT|nr:hypothetical protein [Acetobacter garciniae]MBO1326000.1 hypothetical protein [Acetobacter garciniae]MBX0345900.1 hypothetical protein [Acetobacter garciniae]
MHHTLPFRIGAVLRSLPARPPAPFALAPLAAAFGISLALLPAGAMAAETTSLAGQRVEISLVCPGSLDVSVRPGLDRQVDIQGPWPQGVSHGTDPDGTIRIAQRTCAGNTVLAVSTPPDMPLAINSTSAASLHVGDRKGTLSLLAGGTGPVQVGAVGGLDLGSTSSGPITIGAVTGSARVNATGSAPIEIGQVKADALMLSLGGTSSFVVRSGTLKALQITTASTHDAIFHGTTDLAALHVQAGGAIVVDRATGTLATERDGPGRIEVNEPAEPSSPEHDAQAENPAGSGQAPTLHTAAH